MCLWPCFFWSPMAVHIGQKWQTGTDMRRIFGLNIEAKQNFNTSKEAKHVRHSEWVQEVNKSCLNVFQSPLTFYSISCLSLYFPPLQTFLSSTFIVLLADWRLQQSDLKSIPQSIVCLSNSGAPRPLNHLQHRYHHSSAYFLTSFCQTYIDR